MISLEWGASEMIISYQRLIIYITFCDCFTKDAASTLPRYVSLSQEAVVQYEQYEQEVKNLQRLIEEAHRIIQDRPVSTNNIQELQAQIHHHEVRKDTRCLSYIDQSRSMNKACGNLLL